jgi:cellulose synthase/poly-beta-1,6-N-acetylglucosamine synthase-like glycosyltransferase
MYWLPVILILPYFFILLKINRNLSGIKPFGISSDPRTFVSVVVAFRNEEKNIHRLLADVAMQNYPESLFEVIVVNDGSTDKTVKLATAFSGISNMKILENTGSGKKQALRTGIIAARGNLILTTDADCRPGINWIRTIAAFYELNRPDMIIAPVVLKPLKGFLRRFQEIEFLSLQGVTAGSALSGEPVMCNGANLAFTREIYMHHSHNLHDKIKSGDDIFLLHSLKAREPSKILWLESDDAIVTTESSSSLLSFLDQRSRWISKAGAYSDRYTIILGIVTFAAICLQTSYFIAFLFSPACLPVFLSILILKSIPDLLILTNTSGRYGMRKVMWWFLPAQLIYPFYVLSVLFYSLMFRGK